MVWPIIRAKSYVCETGKSTKVEEMVVAPEDGWRKIPVTLIDLGPKDLECNRLLTTVGNPSGDDSIAYICYLSGNAAPGPNRH